MSTQITTNPFEDKVSTTSTALAHTDSQKGIQEIQAKMIIAQKFPRNAYKSMERIINACTRKGLAESALYSYNKGKTAVTGPSIRLAEVLAQNWGNLDFGVRELSQGNGSSEVEAYCWDLETNTCKSVAFHVSHIQYSKTYGNKVLTDPRDIYEKTANDGARRLRACILSIIPSDVVEAAVNQCAETQHATADTSPEAVKKLIMAFNELSVTEDMLQKRIGNKLLSIRAAQILQLRRIYASLKDGMSKVADWFEGESLPSSSTMVDIKTINDQTDSASIPAPSSAKTKIEMLKEIESLFETKRSILEKTENKLAQEVINILNTEEKKIEEKTAIKILAKLKEIN